MTTLPRLLRTVAVTALGLSLLYAVPDTASALVALPAVGDCHLLTAGDVSEESDTKPKVECGTTHTSLTIAVLTMPEDFAWSDDAVYKKIGVPCTKALDTALGRSARERAMSAYGVTYFIPTAEERGRGASWVRCDALLWGRTSLRPIPDASPLLETPMTDRVKRCLTGRPYNVTVCAQRHSFRATGVAAMKFKTYPGKRKVQRLADAKCPSRVTSSYWRYTYPGPTSWKAGLRLLVCYTKTRR